MLMYHLGEYWKDLDTVILCHALLEGSMLATNDINNDTLSKELLSELFPKYTNTLVEKILERYEIRQCQACYGTTTKRASSNVHSDAAITCNTRWAAAAYSAEPRSPGSYNIDYVVSELAMDSRCRYYVPFQGMRRSHLRI